MNPIMQKINVTHNEGQITQRKFRTFFMGILLFSMEFYRNPIVFLGISYTFPTSDLPLDSQESYHMIKSNSIKQISASQSRARGESLPEKV